MDANETFWDVYRRLGQLHEMEVKELKIKMSQLISSESACSETFTGEMVPYANQQQSTDFTESTCTSRAGSKVRFIRPPEMAPPELATGPGHPDCHSENSPSLPGVTQSRSRKEKKSSSELPRVLHEDTLRSLEGQSSYNVRKIWTEKGDDSLGELTPSGLTRRSSCTLPTVTSFKDDTLQRPEWLRYLLSMLQHPASRFRVWWGPLGMILLAYDVITIPLRFFGLEESLAMTVISWIARLYWSLDILFSFTTGFYDAGLLVLDLRRTSMNYLKGWFVFDLLVVCLDWVLLIWEDFIWEDFNSNTEGLPRLSKTMRITRLFRLVRLGRLLKVGAITENFQEQISSESASIHYSIVRIILWLMVMNHVLACGWFGVAAFSDGRTWITVNQLESESVAYQYTTSLHWAVAQLGVGQTEIEAVSLPERIFSILVMFAALLSLSTLVSSMTSLMARLDQLKTEEVSQFRSLRRFLAENQIEQELSHRVMRFLQHSLNVKKSVQSDDPQVLEMLSKPLQGELQLERHKATFEQNGFFRRMLKQGGFHPIRELRMVAMNCMQPQVMASGDVVFAAGSMANSCFFLAKGSFHYTFEKSYEELSNTWIAEMCLWIPWSYAGDLVAQETSRLFSLDLSAFCKAVAKVDTTREMAVAYAKECVDALNGKQGSVSDLWQSLSERVFSRILPLDMD